MYTQPCSSSYFKADPQTEVGDAILGYSLKGYLKVGGSTQSC